MMLIDLPLRLIDRHKQARCFRGANLKPVNMNTLDVQPLTERAKVLLKAVAETSTNPVCKSHAELYLTKWKDERTQQIASSDGGFMTACLNGDAKSAWWRASGSSRTPEFKEAVFKVLTDY